MARSIASPTATPFAKTNPTIPPPACLSLWPRAYRRSSHSPCPTRRPDAGESDSGRVVPGRRRKGIVSKRDRPVRSGPSSPGGSRGRGTGNGSSTTFYIHCLSRVAVTFFLFGRPQYQRTTKNIFSFHAFQATRSTIDTLLSLAYSHTSPRGLGEWGGGVVHWDSPGTLRRSWDRTRRRSEFRLQFSLDSFSLARSPRPDSGPIHTHHI